MRLLFLAGLVAALGCAHVATRSPDVLVGCMERGGGACLEAGRSELAQGDGRGRLAAAALFMTGCESGAGEACAELAALYHEGAGVPRDDAEACRLGRAASCGLADPAVPPSGPRVTDRGERQPTDATPELDTGLFLRLGEAYPEAWRQDLGFTRASLTHRPPAPASERALADLVTGPRLRAAEACLPVLTDARRDLKVPAYGVIGFTVGKDGRPAGLVVRTAPDEHPGAKAWARCIEERVAPWRLPAFPSGGRLWFEVFAAGPELPDPSLPDTGEPAEPGPGWTKPRMAQPKCVQEAIRVKEPLEPLDVMRFRFAIRADGATDRFEVVSPRVPPRFAASVREAVRTCRWLPGRDPSGRPATVWVVLPLRASGPFGF
ncbi:MAG: hypothetical protein U0229_20390 [Anaeromyxobacter sp.]